MNLNEEFNDTRGQFLGYDAYQAADRESLRGLKHVDIRSFHQDDTRASATLLDNSLQTVAELSTWPVSSLGGYHVLQPGERWPRFHSSNIIGPESDRNYHYGARFSSTVSGQVRDFDSVLYRATTPQSTLHSNLVTNPSFEFNITGWTGGTFSTISRSPQDGIASSGRWMLNAISPSSAGTSSEYVVPYTITPARAGEVYSASLVSRQTVGAGTVQRHVRLRFYNVSDVLLSTSTSTAATGLSANVLQKIEGAVAPANTAYVKVEFMAKNIAAAATAEFLYDSVIAVRESTVPAYFDGDVRGYLWDSSPQASISRGPYNYEVESINILDGFEDDDLISVALPDWPGSAALGEGASMTMTSNPSGDFTIGPSATVLFSSSITSLTTVGDREFRVLRSAFNSIDLSKVTGVRFHIGNTTVRIMAVRLLSKEWSFSPIDINTFYGQLYRTVPRDAVAVPTYNFATPILWRSAEVPGENDPRPIDFDVAVAFNTGSRTQSNQVILYGRELTEDFLTQLDLNGMSMATLNQNEQPDIGDPVYDSRVQSDLEVFDQGQLTGLLQSDLERTPDFLAASWIQFVVQWTSTNTIVSLVNTEGVGYQFNLGAPLAVNTKYLLVATLNDTTARATIYPLIGRDQIDFDHPIFDSTLIDDDFAYKRRKGRFGWYTNLQDGDAYIESIRFRSTTFAEYRSLPFESLTPVAGAEVFAASTPDRDLFAGFEPTADSVTVDRDHDLSTSGESWRVTDYGTYTYQGLQSNAFEISDFEQTEVALDIYYPSNPDLDAGLDFYLKSESDYLVPLPRPVMFPDQWQSIRLRVPNTYLFQTGFHRLVILQNRPSNVNWWVDKVRVFSRSVSWYARSVAEDPWGTTQAAWTPLKNGFNREFGGVMFPARDRFLQVRALGHSTDAALGKIQFKPAYAQLGRLVWPDQELTNLIKPVASYSTSNIGRTYTFNGSASSDADGTVINWSWTISDGSIHNGPIIAHTFTAAGTYNVTLVVTDSNGLTHSLSQNHVVA